mgnify:CR=1 FL=1
MFPNSYVYLFKKMTNGLYINWVCKKWPPQFSIGISPPPTRNFPDEIPAENEAGRNGMTKAKVEAKNGRRKYYSAGRASQTGEKKRAKAMITYDNNNVWRVTQHAESIMEK